MDVIDPFLLLDELGPVALPPGNHGFPDHPHRGFETVTYVLEGEAKHKDSQGNEGSLGPGSVQWMTAGSGVLHSEMLNPGAIHLFQLWVNLPKKDKMIRPGYQELKPEAIPSAQSGDGKVRVKVIAGEALGVHAKIETRTPILYLHYEVEPGGSVEQSVPAGFQGFIYVSDGEAQFDGSKRAVRGDVAILSQDGDSIEIRNPATATKKLSFLLIAGVPLKEPVARYGPFVMNTKEEIMQAFSDYRSGRFGEIAS
jgi:hypothetical protein